jgi:hypothetical protein
VILQESVDLRFQLFNAFDRHGHLRRKNSRLSLVLTYDLVKLRLRPELRLKTSTNKVDSRLAEPSALAPVSTKGNRLDRPLGVAKAVNNSPAGQRLANNERISLSMGLPFGDGPM